MICANALHLPYADRSAHMACTSPPYYAKRRYEGVEPSTWPAVCYSPMPGLPPLEIPAVTAEVIAETPEAGLLGLEPDPFAYIGHLVLIFREIWRVLRDDGILCVNIGDSFNGGGNGPRGATAADRISHGHQPASNPLTRNAGCDLPPGLKPKDLMGIPWRLAFALCADGWTLRSRMPGGVEMRPDIIWTKNAMPESVTDRPSVDFEDVFIMSKSRRYVWDQENGRTAYRPMGGQHGGGFQGQEQMAPRGQNGDHFSRFYGGAGANMRASWRINTEPTSERHWAAWPRELVRRLIRIGTSDKGCCPGCEAQWVRVTKRTPVELRPNSQSIRGNDASSRASTSGAQRGSMAVDIEELGWSPSCSCPPADPVPCSVLDPFSGIGRTGEVCFETGRRYMSAELSVGYAAIQARRLADHVAVKRGEALPPREAVAITGPLFA